MLFKRVLCDKCKGRGFISECTENSISSRRCDKCDGSGISVSPMTNGDIIRTCSNEQLLIVHNNLKQYAIYSGGDKNRQLGSSDSDILLWFNKEADYTDLTTIFSFIDVDKWNADILGISAESIDDILKAL